MFKYRASEPLSVAVGEYRSRQAVSIPWHDLNSTTLRGFWTKLYVDFRR